MIHESCKRLSSCTSVWMHVYYSIMCVFMHVCMYMDWNVCTCACFVYMYVCDCEFVYMQDGWRVTVACTCSITWCMYYVCIYACVCLYCIFQLFWLFEKMNMMCVSFYWWLRCNFYREFSTLSDRLHTVYCRLSHPVYQ